MDSVREYLEEILYRNILQNNVKCYFPRGLSRLKCQLFYFRKKAYNNVLLEKPLCYCE